LRDTPDRAQVLEKLKTGRYTFVLDNEAEFAADHMDAIEVPKAGEVISDNEKPTS
jgi:hypothetical protein